MLLDEPLANLDYKLREGLRDELPRLFADRDCTVVYATTEPAETLLLGGHTATLHEGRDHAIRPDAGRVSPPGGSDDRAGVLRPTDQHGARHEARLADRDQQCRRLERRAVNWRRWPTARTRLGCGRIMCSRPRPACKRTRRWAWTSTRFDGVRVSGQVSVAEISGSESVVHFDLHGLGWVSQSHGVHRFAVGATADFRLDVDARPVFRCPRALCQRGWPLDGTGVAMARIGLKNVRHSYREHPASDADWAVKAPERRMGRRQCQRTARPVGLRQDDAAEHHFGPVAADRRGRVLRRPRRDRGTAGCAQHRAGVPVPGRLRHDERVRQPGVPAAQSRHSRRAESTSECARSPRCSTSSRC